jgi:hypothetical protein
VISRRTRVALHDRPSRSIALPRLKRIICGKIPIALAAPPLPHFPRFRALALFRRRPHQPVARSSIPASENLHMSRHSVGVPAYLQANEAGPFIALLPHEIGTETA